MSLARCVHGIPSRALPLPSRAMPKKPLFSADPPEIPKSRRFLRVRACACARTRARVT